MFAFCYSIVIKILRQWSYEEAFITLIRRTVSCTASSANDTSACENLLTQDLRMGQTFYISSLEIQLTYACLWYSGIQALAIKQFCSASVLTSFAPRVLRSWQRLVVPELIYSNDLTDEISCIFWFTEFRLCLPVWIKQTSYMRIIPRYHIGAFVQGWKADLVAGGTSCSFLREQHCHFLGHNRYYNSLYDL